VARDRKGRGREIDSGQVRLRQGKRQGNGDGAGACTHVQNMCVRLQIDSLQYRFHQVFRLGPRDQDVWCHGEGQAKELLHAEDVLDRFESGSPGDEVFKLRRLVRGEHALRMSEQSCSVASQDMPEQHFGVAPRIL